MLAEHGEATTHPGKSGKSLGSSGRVSSKFRPDAGRWPAGIEVIEPTAPRSQRSSGGCPTPKSGPATWDGGASGEMLPGQHRGRRQRKLQLNRQDRTNASGLHARFQADRELREARRFSHNDRRISSRAIAAAGGGGCDNAPRRCDGHGVLSGQSGYWSHGLVPRATPDSSAAQAWTVPPIRLVVTGKRSRSSRLN